MTYVLIYLVIGSIAGFFACALLGAGARADAYVDSVTEGEQ